MTAGERKDDVMTKEAERNLKLLPAGSAHGAEGSEPRNARNAALEAENCKEMKFLLNPSEGLWPCQHLDFCPVKPTLDF